MEKENAVNKLLQQRYHKTVQGVILIALFMDEYRVRKNMLSVFFPVNGVYEYLAEITPESWESDNIVEYLVREKIH